MPGTAIIRGNATGRRRVIAPYPGLAFVALLFGANSPAIANVQGMVDVQLEVATGCLLAGSVIQGRGPADLGTIDLGRHARLDEVDGPVAGQSLSVEGTEGIYIECNPGTSYRMEADAGANGGTGDLRFLVRRGETTGVTKNRDVVAYRLFADSAWREPLIAGRPVDGVTPPTGRVPLRLFARIESSAAIPAAGTYWDRIRLTLSW